jgi:hypothetical protein
VRAGEYVVYQAAGSGGQFSSSYLVGQVVDIEDRGVHKEGRAAYF